MVGIWDSFDDLGAEQFLCRHDIPRSGRVSTDGSMAQPPPTRSIMMHVTWSSRRSLNPHLAFFESALYACLSEWWCVLQNLFHQTEAAAAGGGREERRRPGREHRHQPQHPDHHQGEDAGILCRPVRGRGQTVCTARLRINYHNRISRTAQSLMFMPTNLMFEFPSFFSRIQGLVLLQALPRGHSRWVAD